MARSPLAHLLPAEAVGSVWTVLREQDAVAEAEWAAEAAMEARQAEYDRRTVARLAEDLARDGECTLVLGKRWVDCYDPLYDLVVEMIPECRIVCEYDVYREEAQAEQEAARAREIAGGLSAKLFAGRRTAAV